MELRITPNDKGKAVMVFLAILFVLSAYFTYAYWSESSLTAMYISLAVLVAVGLMIIYFSWAFARHNRALRRAAEPVFFEIESGPKHAPVKKEEAKPVFKTKMP